MHTLLPVKGTTRVPEPPRPLSTGEQSSWASVARLAIGAAPPREEVEVDEEAEAPPAPTLPAFVADREETEDSPDNAPMPFAA